MTTMRDIPSRRHAFRTLPHLYDQLPPSRVLPGPMCYWRKVRNIYMNCNHAVKLPDEHIDCFSLTCKFSSVHPPTCVPPRCIETCWQYHQYPQQYAPQINSWCPSCLALNK